MASFATGSGGDVGAEPVFYLKLEKTYYSKGFFNVLREFDHLVGNAGTVTLALRGNGDVEGTVNRTWNRNGTARIMGGKVLRDWFQRNYSMLDTVSVRFDGPRRLVLE